MHFHAAAGLSDVAIGQVPERVRRRVLKAFVRWGLLDEDAREEMLVWQYGGGFSLDVSVRIEADDIDGLERLLRYQPLHLRWRCLSVSHGPILARHMIRATVRYPYIRDIRQPTPQRPLTVDCGHQDVAGCNKIPLFLTCLVLAL